MQENYDVIIIGTGAGGGTMAYALAETGKRILVLDRGEYIPREKANWSPEAAYIQGAYRSSDRWLDPTGDAFEPNQYHRVGGGTKIYGAALLRMRAEDFGNLQHYEGSSPTWELGYSDFAPYYAAAERLYKVHGQRQTDPSETNTAEITDGYPAAPLPHSDRIQQVATQLQRAGLQPFPLPMGVDYDPGNQQLSPCILCDTCDGYACLLNAKADAQTCGIDLALRYANVTLMTGAKVERLQSAGRQITAVEARVNGQVKLFRAEIVIAACGAIGSADLLLRSATDEHPNGLANGSDQVGRNLMRHNVTKLYAIDLKTPNPTVFQKTLAVNDFYLASERSPYPLGHVHLMGKHKWQMMQPDFPKLVPQPLLKWLSAHSVDWWMQSEDLPEASNCVRLTAQGQVQIDYRPNNLKAHQELKRQFKQVLRQIGFPLLLEVQMPLKVLNHQCGTCRFGTDPANSVLDLNCKAHELDNLYVVDASFFPSASAINPTLTIVANALRVADHLKQQMADRGQESLNLQDAFGIDG